MKTMKSTKLTSARTRTAGMWICAILAACLLMAGCAPQPTYSRFPEASPTATAALPTEAPTPRPTLSLPTPRPETYFDELMDPSSSSIPTSNNHTISSTAFEDADISLEYPSDMLQIYEVFEDYILFESVIAGEAEIAVYIFDTELEDLSDDELYDEYEYIMFYFTENYEEDEEDFNYTISEGSSYWTLTGTYTDPDTKKASSLYVYVSSNHGITFGIETYCSPDKLSEYTRISNDIARTIA